MEYKVLLNQNQEGKYVATAPALPGYIGQGDTEEEAVTNIFQKVTALLSKTKVVTIDVPIPDVDVQSHPWLRNFGLFKDEPAFDQMMRRVYKKRSGDYPE
jgi:predicted RNase H-like HicB family nuclease